MRWLQVRGLWAGDLALAPTCNGILGWLRASLSLGFLLSTMGVMLGISVAE